MILLKYKSSRHPTQMYTFPRILGKSDAAGAIADGFTLSRADKKRLDPNNFLLENNSYEFFLELDDLFMTGSSGTNVMDIQVIL